MSIMMSLAGQYCEETGDYTLRYVRSGFAGTDFFGPTVFVLFNQRREIELVCYPHLIARNTGEVSGPAIFG